MDLLHQQLESLFELPGEEWLFFEWSKKPVRKRVSPVYNPVQYRYIMQKQRLGRYFEDSTGVSDFGYFINRYI